MEGRSKIYINSRKKKYRRFRKKKKLGHFSNLVGRLRDKPLPRSATTQEHITCCACVSQLVGSLERIPIIQVGQWKSLLSEKSPIGVCFSNTRFHCREQNVLIFHSDYCFVVWYYTFLHSKREESLIFPYRKDLIYYGRDRNAKFLSFVETEFGRGESFLYFNVSLMFFGKIFFFFLIFNPMVNKCSTSIKLKKVPHHSGMDRAKKKLHRSKVGPSSPFN